MARSQTWTCDGCGTKMQQRAGALPPQGWLTLEVVINGNGGRPETLELCPACGAEGFPALRAEIAKQVSDDAGAKLMQSRGRG